MLKNQQKPKQKYNIINNILILSDFDVPHYNMMRDVFDVIFNCSFSLLLLYNQMQEKKSIVLPSHITFLNLGSWFNRCNVLSLRVKSFDTW